MCDIRLVALSNNNEKFYKKCWVDAMKYHVSYGEGCGVFDRVCAYATETKALQDIPENEKCFIIVSDNKEVGFIVYNEDTNWYQKPTRKVSFIYVISEMRGNGIASKVLSDLHKDSFIVLECWYDLPSLGLYQKLGFEELYKGLIWK